MISVYTPSHNPTYLDQCYDSLISQTYTNWEWIVVLNGNADWTPPKGLRTHVSIRRDLTGKVGALKQYACSLAKGDILVELDHDDILTPDCLQILHETFQIPGVDFAYSDTAQMNADGSRNDSKFAEGHGWRYYDTDDGLIAFESKPPTPHNVSYIWYAPNHVRAFTRTLYDAVGGYNSDLTVCDDADLMVRMYQHSDFTRIPLTLYHQRIHDNTQRDPATNALIQTETVRIYDENIQPNSLAWAQRNDLPCYDLGGAHNSPNGYQPIDISLGDGDVIEWLSNQPDNSVGVYRAVDFLEHVPDKITLMNELYRTLAPGGMLLTLTPSTDGRGAFCDPTHVSFWNSLSFRYYTDPEYQKYVPAITCRFRLSRLFDYYPTQWHETNLVPYVCANLTKE